MRIYHCVESYYPSVGGMQEVVKQLSERLVQLGHEVIVLTRHHNERTFSELNGVKLETFKINGNPLEVKDTEDQRYVDYLLTLQGDVITFFAAQQWATNLALPILNQIKAKKVSVPTGYSGLYWPMFKEYFESMKTWIHGYDMNVYLSYDYRDINFARENGVTKWMVIPNGAAADEFLAEEKTNVRKELGASDDEFLILHVGSYTGWKGHREAMDMFLRSDIKQGTLLMIGNHYQYFKLPIYKFPLLKLRLFLNKLFGKKRIVFNYFSREFTVAAYKQADLFLFPSNIECSPIVLFECAAAKLPFLSTDVGNSVEIAQWTSGGEILPTHKDASGFSHADIAGSVKVLNRLYADKTKRRQLGEKAFENWKEKYSWEVITKQYETLYKDLLKA